VLVLEPLEIRVIGCLMEKEATTPDNYPLTVNSLLLACNQTTNRDPIMHVGETALTAALTHLRELRLTRIVYSPSNRAPKHRHVVSETLRLDAAEQAVLCVLLLRGPQTPGELKVRTERQHGFDDLGQLEATLDALAARDEPLVKRLNRRPGQKEARWMHLVGGPVADDDADDIVPSTAGGAARAERVADLSGRIEALEAQVARVDALEAQLAELSATIDQLRALLD
jgi:uncharacterized protein YceH (UPF0502 family)